MPDNQPTDGDGFAYLWREGFVTWFDLPFLLLDIAAFVWVPLTLWLWPDHVVKLLLSYIVFHGLWLAATIFRVCFFQLKVIQAISNMKMESARIVAKFISQK